MLGILITIAVIARADAHSRLRKAENRKNFGLSFAFYRGVC